MNDAKLDLDQVDREAAALGTITSLAWSGMDRAKASLMNGRFGEAAEYLMAAAQTVKHARILVAGINFPHDPAEPEPDRTTVELPTPAQLISMFNLLVERMDDHGWVMNDTQVIVETGVDADVFRRLGWLNRPLDSFHNYPAGALLEAMHEENPVWKQ